MTIGLFGTITARQCRGSSWPTNLRFIVRDISPSGLFFVECIETISVPNASYYIQIGQTQYLYPSDVQLESPRPLVLGSPVNRTNVHRFSNVVCKSNKYSSLTENAVYQVKDVHHYEDLILLTNDNGYCRWYSMRYFVIGKTIKPARSGFAKFQRKLEV